MGHRVTKDEGLHEVVEHCDKDVNDCNLDYTSCRDWAVVKWLRGIDSIPTLVCDNEDGQNRHGYMYKAFMSTITTIKDGAVINASRRADDKPRLIHSFCSSIVVDMRSLELSSCILAVDT
jgi:hypothetical protein